MTEAVGSGGQTTIWRAEDLPQYAEGPTVTVSALAERISACNPDPRICELVLQRLCQNKCMQRDELPGCLELFGTTITSLDEDVCKRRALNLCKNPLVSPKCLQLFLDRSNGSPPWLGGALKHVCMGPAVGELLPMFQNLDLDPDNSISSREALKNLCANELVTPESLRQLRKIIDDDGDDVDIKLWDFFEALKYLCINKGVTEECLRVFQDKINRLYPHQIVGLVTILGKNESISPEHLSECLKVFQNKIASEPEQFKRAMRKLCVGKLVTKESLKIFLNAGVKPDFEILRALYSANASKRTFSACFSLLLSKFSFRDWFLFSPIGLGYYLLFHPLLTWRIIKHGNWPVRGGMVFWTLPWTILLSPALIWCKFMSMMFKVGFEKAPTAEHYIP